MIKKYKINFYTFIEIKSQRISNPIYILNLDIFFILKY